MGKSSINSGFSIAMFDYWRVYQDQSRVVGGIFLERAYPTSLSHSDIFNFYSTVHHSDISIEVYHRIARIYTSINICL